VWQSQHSRLDPDGSSYHSIDFLEPLSNVVSGLHRGWRLPSPAKSQSARKDSRKYLFIIMIRSLNALLKLMNGAARAKCIRSKDRRRQDESAELHNDRRNPKTSSSSKLIIQHLLGVYLSSLLGISRPTLLKFCLFQTPSNHSSGENKHAYPARSRSSLRHLR
jgi:hypothetical protein